MKQYLKNVFIGMAWGIMYMVTIGLVVVAVSFCNKAEAQESYFLIEENQYHAMRCWALGKLDGCTGEKKCMEFQTNCLIDHIVLGNVQEHFFRTCKKKHCSRSGYCPLSLVVYCMRQSTNRLLERLKAPQSNDFIHYYDLGDMK